MRSQKSDSTLRNLHAAETKRKYPNVPDYALPDKKWSDRTANGLTQMIEDWCNLNDVFVHRISSEGRYRPGDEVEDVLGRKRQMKGKWLPGLNTGLPDLFTIVDGLFVGIEVKIGRDKQSDVQKKMQRKIEASGGVYLIIKTYAEFERLYINQYFE